MRRYVPAEYWDARLRLYGSDIRGVADVDRSIEDNERSYAAGSLVVAKAWEGAGFVCAQVSLLDIGCGQGHYAALFKTSGGRRYTGVDITDVLFPNLARRFPGFIFRRLDVTKEELPGEHELILMLDVTQHIVGDDEFRFAMANIRRHLGAGGLFMVTAMLTPRRLQLAPHCVGRPLAAYREAFAGHLLSEPVSFRDKHLITLRRSL